MKQGGRKLAPKKKPSKDFGVVLVGTYKDKQLDWIKKNNIYNYPVRDGDKLTDEECGKVKNWCYYLRREVSNE